MRFENVIVESFAHVLPERVVSSAEIEARLAPLYERLHLSAGRLELMSGIRERRFFEPGTRPSSMAARAGTAAIEKWGIDRAKIGVVIHASVCRDFLEPATASVVHRALELSARCSAFDLSNACLGFANAMVVVANMIDRREIEAGIVVACEDGRALVDSTIESLLALEDRTNTSVGSKRARESLKRAYASLTIGSGAAACVLAHRDIARSSRRLVGGAARAATEHVELCHGDFSADSKVASGMLMETDSEALLVAGNALAQETWNDFERETGWTTRSVERVVTHQVGVAHRRLLMSTLGLDAANDFPTVETLGNIGSVSLPLTFSIAEERGFIRAGQKVAMLGIGSGLNCLMLGVR